MFQFLSSIGIINLKCAQCKTNSIERERERESHRRDVSKEFFLFSSLLDGSYGADNFRCQWWTHCNYTPSLSSSHLWNRCLWVDDVAISLSNHSKETETDRTVTWNNQRSINDGLFPFPKASDNDIWNRTNRLEIFSLHCCCYANQRLDLRSSNSEWTNSPFHNRSASVAKWMLNFPSKCSWVNSKFDQRRR